MKEGATLGPYVVRRHLGDGGMGSVWLADDTRLHRQVALKTLRAARAADTAGRERLLREARAVAALNHPQIASVYDVIEMDGDVAIVLEYVKGPTLAAELSNGPWPVDRAIDAALQLAKALRAAHAQGIVHRDLKPSNIIIGSDGLKVLDFGIARLLPLGTTVTTGVETTSGPGFIGTAAYAAPEQLLSSAVDERADLYALGVILFEMVAGKRPFAGHDAVALATDKLGRDAPALSASGARVPEALASLVAALLERDPAARPASASDVVHALQAITGEPEPGTLPGSRRRRLAWYAGAAAATLVAAVTVLVLGVRLPGVAELSAAQPVIAVLPLRNTSADPSKDFLAAGLSENLIASLASTPSLIVLSRAAVAEAVKDGADTSRILKALGASFVIDGSVQQSGSQLRVAINLVRADQSIAWGGTFDGTIDKVFDLQTRMALAVSEAMSAGRPSTPAKAETTQPAALEAYWRGRAFLDRWDVKGNVDAAISALSESVSDDPKFALAHAGLGLAYWQKYNDTRDQQFAKLSIDSGSRAAALDPDRPEVRYALATSLDGTGRRDEAVAQLKQAIELRPTYDEARRKLGSVLAAAGRIDDAVAEFDRAIALRPRFWGGYSEKGLALLAAARYQDAATAFEQVVTLQPDNSMGFQQLGTAYQYLGDTARALTAYEQALAIGPSWGAYSNLGMLHHISGHYAKAAEAYQQAIALRPNAASGWRNLGDAYARMGKRAEAGNAYKKAVERAEADLAVNPTSARTLASLGVYLVKAGRASDGRAKMSQALALAPDDVQVRYRAAVVNALTGRRDEALKEIAAAIERGYSVRAAREDEDLEVLRSVPQFSRLTTATTER